MSYTSGTSEQIISLPKGGGVMGGIGEKFSPDLLTGTGNFTVPIALPPGRHGFQPELNLVYSAGHGNGPYGLGWSLSILEVSCKTSKGEPLFDDEKDAFLLSGAEDLVLVPGGLPGTTRYQTGTEGLFAHISHHRDVSNDYWEVSSTVQTDGPHEWDQLFLSEIRYVDYGDLANPHFLVTVHLTCADRPDPFSDYCAGFEIRTVRRCTEITIATRADTEILTRTYELVYLDQQGLPAEQLPRNGVSMLKQIHVIGHDGGRTEALPPLEFGLTLFAPEQRHFMPITGPDMPRTAIFDPLWPCLDGVQAAQQADELFVLVCRYSPEIIDVDSL